MEKCTECSRSIAARSICCMQFWTDIFWDVGYCEGQDEPKFMATKHVTEPVINGKYCFPNMYVIISSRGRFRSILFNSS